MREQTYALGMLRAALDELSVQHVDDFLERFAALLAHLREKHVLGSVSLALLTASLNWSSQISHRFRLSPAPNLNLSHSLTTVSTRKRSACSADSRVEWNGVAGWGWPVRGSGPASRPSSVGRTTVECEYVWRTVVLPIPSGGDLSLKLPVGAQLGGRELLFLLLLSWACHGYIWARRVLLVFAGRKLLCRQSEEKSACY